MSAKQKLIASSEAIYDTLHLHDIGIVLAALVGGGIMALVVCGAVTGIGNVLHALGGTKPPERDSERQEQKQ